MLKKYKYVSNNRFSRMAVARHCIELSSTRGASIQSASYRANFLHQKLERKEVEKMREARVDQPVVVEWFSLVVAVPKKDGSLRFVAANVIPVPSQNEKATLCFERMRVLKC